MNRFQKSALSFVQSNCPPLLTRGIIVLFILLTFSQSYSNPFNGFFEVDDSQTGTASLQFLKIPVGARALAMGGNLSAIDQQASTLYWNPAGLSEFDRYSSTIDHSEIFGQWRHEFLGGIIPLRKSIDALGFALNALYTTPVDYARDINENPTDFLALDLDFSALYGREIIPGILSAGLKLGWINSRIDNASGNGFSMDFGFRWKLIHSMSAAVSLHNVSPGFSYNTGTHTLEKVPMILRASLGLPRTQNWSWQIGYTKSNDGMQKAGVGLEYLIKNIFFLRGGWEKDISDRELGWNDGISAGAGIQINSITIDYGLRFTGDLGETHSISLSLTERNPKKRSKSWLEKAREAYREGKCHSASKASHKVLIADPQNFEAIAMIQQCRKNSIAKMGDRFTFIFTANTNGKLGPIAEERAYIGGMSRRKTAIQSLTKTFPEALKIDAGNILHKGSSNHTESFWLSRAMKSMEYDAIYLTPGDSNLYSDSVGRNLPWLPKNGKSWKVHSSTIFETGLSSNNSGSILSQWEKVLPANVDLSVLLFDGNPQQLSTLTTSPNAPDLIILSGFQEALAQPMLLGHSVVVCSGQQGKYVGRISFYKDPITQKFTWDHSLIELNASISADPKVDSLLSGVIVKLGNQNNSKPIYAWNHPEFLIANPYQKDQIDLSLTNPNKNLTFRLTKKPNNYQQAALAYIRHELLYLLKTPKGGKIEIQSTKSKTPLILNDSLENVFRVKWGPRENWVWYAYYDVAMRTHLNRITPMRLEKTDLTGNRFTDIRDFSVAPTRRVFAVVNGSEQILWHGRIGSSVFTQISPKGYIASNPIYSPNSNRLAFLIKPISSDSLQQTSIAVYNFLRDTLVISKSFAKINDLNWMPDSKKLLYSSGVNLTDINTFDSDTHTYMRVTPDRMSDEVHSESHPRPKIIRGIYGILYQYSTENLNSIRWISEDGQTSLILNQNSKLF